MKIFIIYYPELEKELAQIVNNEDYILTDQLIETNANIINCMKIPLPHKELINEFFRVCESLPKITSRYTQAFMNGIYESSVLPLMRYYFGLQYVIEEHKNEISEIIFQAGIKNIYSSTYYMAEHEPQAIRWYDRACVFTPYLVNLIEHFGLKYSIFTYRSATLTRWHIFIRKYAVFLGKLAFSLIGHFRYLKSKTYKKMKKMHYYNSFLQAKTYAIITRSKSQTYFFLNYIRKTRRNLVLLFGESLMQWGTNLKTIEESQNLNIPIISLINPLDVFRLIWYYFESLIWLMKNRQPQWFRHGIFSLNLRNAVDEMIIMMPELRLYEFQLRRAINSLGKHCVKALFTAEQKSRYAFIDGLVAKEHGAACLQFMACDQSYEAIPIPVSGDVYFVDGIESKKKFSQQFPDNYFDYVGSLKGLGKRKEINDKNPCVCFCTKPIHLDINRQAILLLHRICKKNGWRFLVKLHPRDKASNYSSIEDVEFISHSEIEQSKLFERIDIAVSGLSGLVMDLLFANIPYLIINYKDGERYLRPIYIDDDYKNICTKISDLEKRLSDIYKIKDEFELFRERFFTRNKIIVDVDEIDDRIDNIIKERLAR